MVMKISKKAKSRTATLEIYKARSLVGNRDRKFGSSLHDRAVLKIAQCGKIATSAGEALSLLEFIEKHGTPQGERVDRHHNPKLHESIYVQKFSLPLALTIHKIERELCYQKTDS